MPPSGAKFPTCWKMHRRASHAFFIHRRGFSTFRHECIASQRVAGPLGWGSGGGGHVFILENNIDCGTRGRGALRY